MTDIRKKLAGKTTKLAQNRPKKDDHPASPDDCREGSYYNLDINLILPDPELAEKIFDQAALEELAASIRQHRLYQPVVVRRNEMGQIILVAGRQRLIAAKMAGLQKIPAIFTEGNPLKISLIENLQRGNLKPVEETEAIGSMIEQHDHTEEKLAFAIGKAQPAIAEAIKLNRLSEPIKDGIATVEEVSFKAILPEHEIETIEQSKKTQLLTELQNLIKIIDGIITDGK